MPIQLSLFPTKPGVYLMRDIKGVVIYVGKAINLKKRLQQYFVPGRDSRPQIPMLVAKVVDVETIVVSSEKEALLLEHSLIKEHHPRYNFLLKDDKSFICIQISKGPWPALKLVRSKDVHNDSDIYGPYPSAFSARKMLDLLQRLFPLRECSDFVLKNRSRPCILQQIGRCIAPCVKQCSKEEYMEYVHQARQFLKGQNESIIKDLKLKMKKASENMQYEMAKHYLQTIRHIESLLEKQHVVSNSKIDCEVIGLYREGACALLSLLIFKKGLLIDVQTFPISNDTQTDSELISSFIYQNYSQKKQIPHEILSPTRLELDKTLSSIISEQKPHTARILYPQKGSKTALLKMAYENAQSAFDKTQRQKISREQLLLDLKEKLELTNYPQVIECFDNSHLSGSSPVSVMISFVGGSYDKSRLRKYHLRTDQVFDDLKGFEEVLLRRYKNQELPPPDLIVIDGGRNQLNVALKVFRSLNIVNVDIVSLVKEKGRHDFGMSQEKVCLPNRPSPLVLPTRSSLLFLLQSIRDQAHRAAISFHRKSRSKSTFQSVLDQIPGIGPRKKKALIQHFKSPQKVKEASEEELKKVSLLTQKDLENIQLFFKK